MIQNFRKLHNQNVKQGEIININSENDYALITTFNGTKCCEFP